MARRVTVGGFQAMQRADQPVTVATATADALTSHVVDGDPGAFEPAAEDAEATAQLEASGCGHPVEPKADDQAGPTATESTMADELQALEVASSCTAEMSLGMIRARVAERATQLTSYPSESEIAAEADRIWRSFHANRTGHHEYDVDPSGAVRDWRRPDPGPARDPFEPPIHTISGDGVTATITNDATGETISLEAAQRRFSGAGAGEDLSRTAPWMVLRIPSETEFGDDEFFASTALAHRAELLTERHPEHFAHLSDMKVVYLWKKAGGRSKGRGVFGKTTKPAGLLKMFSEATFVIWLAADHCRGAGYRERELEALLFHEMLHCGESQPDEETGRGGGPVLIPHELEIFRAEVEVYGLWAADLREVAPAFDAVGRQPSLFDAMLPGDAIGAAREILDPADDDGAGTLIWPDGSPMSAEDIARMEAAELADIDTDELIEADAADDVAAFDGEPLTDVARG